ncbi:MAG TPA: adenylate/guanylate cyclase domain-containing protein [Bryobacteraceae bacterium]|nr:adenylate/guanylate cyclase domain-containing protein [Bryobacteraceae bacterium]
MADARQVSPETPDEFEATVFVSSVKGFTRRSETMALSDIAAWSNAMFYQVTESVLRFGGVPAKCVGDGLLAYFAGGNHASRAVRAAISARESVTDQLVVALSSGTVHLAAIGHPSMARPDILGPVVNCAFRVREWVQSNAPDRIGVTADTLRDLDTAGFRIGKYSTVNLKGFGEPVTIHEIIGETSK